MGTPNQIFIMIECEKLIPKFAIIIGREFQLFFWVFECLTLFLDLSPERN